VVCTDIDECASNPCQNGGLCKDFVNHFVCDCTTDYIDETCAIGTVNINFRKLQPEHFVAPVIRQLTKH
jgi:hypothetical protein